MTIYKKKDSSSFLVFFAKRGDYCPNTGNSNPRIDMDRGLEFIFSEKRVLWNIFLLMIITISIKIGIVILKKLKICKDAAWYIYLKLLLDFLFDESRVHGSGNLLSVPRKSGMMSSLKDTWIMYQRVSGMRCHLLTYGFG